MQLGLRYITISMKKIVLFIILCLGTLIWGQDKEPEIIKRFVKYDAERIKLSLEYMQKHHNLIQKEPTIVPKMIVLHYTAGGTVDSNFNYFNKNRIESQRKYIKDRSPLNVSAHYIVGRDGKIYQLIPNTMFARHTIGLNYMAIGVENIGSKEQPLTDAQVKANAALVRHLTKTYGIEYLIGHYEYGIFRNSSLWKETDKNYFTGKADPGKEFMTKVRALVSDLKLKGKP